ncbi:MAG: Flp family type IVb pilin [bacterium]
MNRPESKRQQDPSESGQSTIEYGLVVTVMMLTVIAVFVALGPEFRELLQDPVEEDARGDRQSALSSAVYK